MVKKTKPIIRREKEFNLNEYLTSATLKAIIKDIEIAIKKLDDKSKIITKHLNSMKGK